MQTFTPHEVSWTAEKIGRFWDFLASNGAKESEYFSHAYGRFIVAHAEKAGRLPEPVLDYGCGPGFLMERLLGRGYQVQGLDFSSGTVEKANERCRVFPTYRGATVAGAADGSIAPESMGTVFLVEAIEHLLEDELARVLTELYRVLRPGGMLVVTTPNQEDLRASQVMCPDCGGVFHPIQHVVSWSRDSLTKQLEEFGFERIRCTEEVFRRRDATNLAFRLAYAITGKRRPNLVYVGRRR